MFTTAALLALCLSIILIYAWARENEDDDPPSGSEPVNKDPLTMMQF